MYIIHALPLFDKNVSEDKKLVKLITPLPASPEPQALVFSTSDMTFDQLASSAQADISQGKYCDEQARPTPDDQPQHAIFAG